MFQLNPSPVELARGASYLIGGLGLAMGFRAIMTPALYAQSFGFHPSTRVLQTADSNPFIIVAGGRAIASGVGLLALAYIEANSALAVLLCTAVIVGAVDAYAVIEYASSEEPQSVQTVKVQADAPETEQERTKLAKRGAAGHIGLTTAFSLLGLWMLATPE